VVTLTNFDADMQFQPSSTSASRFPIGSSRRTELNSEHQRPRSKENGEDRGPLEIVLNDPRQLTR
jgi:hypothetical protein